MKKWEDIVKDIMEEPDSALPECVFAEFRARRAAGRDVTRKTTRPLIWALATAVAAGLAALLLLRKPNAPEEGLQLIQQHPMLEVQVMDTSDVVPRDMSTLLIAQATTPRTVRQPATVKQEEIVNEPEQPDLQVTEDVVTDNAPSESADDEPSIADYSPFIPQSARDKNVKVNVGTGAVIAGGGLAAILATQLVKSNARTPNQAYANLSLANGGAFFPGTNNLGDLGSYSHRMPVIVGISTRIRVTEKLGITTGLEYSLYTSLYTNSLFSGNRTQHVHYLGVPVRLDWVFVSNKWLDIYAGAGMKGDFCLGANITETELGRDGPAFRLLGASGIQFNATSYLGIYVEPVISWTLPSKRRVLSTYSNDHPWMFSVAAGVRFNLGY